MKKTLENKNNRTAFLEQRVQPTKKRQAVKNDIVTSYFTNLAENFKNISKKDHKNAVIEMINKATVKDLQKLPTIGSKTAYQLVSSRAINGNFKTLNDVKKALKLSEKAWDKFLEVSYIFFELLRRNLA